MLRGLALDVTQADQIAQSARTIAENEGEKLYALINNAGTVFFILAEKVKIFELQIYRSSCQVYTSFRAQIWNLRTPSGVAPTGLMDWMGVGHYRGVMEVNYVLHSELSNSKF
jgi:NAD(P)-dependent dehydrogenase (short-subunit alcohol dehydrogenase family)